MLPLPVYVHELANGFAAERVIAVWMTFYGCERPLSALGGRTPVFGGCRERGDDMTRVLAKSGVGVGALAVALGLSTVSLLAQQMPSVVLEAGEVKEHPTGVYRYETVELGRDAILGITGTTSIVAERMIFDERATISYKKLSSPADHTKTLTLLVADASGSSALFSRDNEQWAGTLPVARDHGRRNRSLPGGGTQGAGGGDGTCARRSGCRR